MNAKFKSKATIVLLAAMSLSQVQVLLTPERAFAEAQVSDITVRASASEGDLTLEWSDPSTSQSLNISAPGLNLKDLVDQGTTEVSGFDPREHISVVIEVRSDVSGSLLNEIVKETGYTPAEAAAGFEAVEVKSIDLVMPVSGVTSTSAEAATQPSATSFRYTTFIPEEKVYDFMVNLCPESLGSYFMGDNRTFDSSSASFRTRVNVRVDWIAGGLVSFTKTAGVSTAYIYVRLSDYIGYYVKASDYADLGEVTVKTRYSSPTHVVFTMDHNAVDPLCKAAVEKNAGIKYHYDVTVQRSGNYGLIGWALRAPAHEAYIRDSESTSWKPVFQRENKGFYCLLWNDFPGCKAESNYSGLVQ
ncbi:MAG: hypothetical protein ACKOWR_05090 [Micrococcales bacterium]